MDALTIGTPEITVTALPAHGFTVSSIADRASGAEALWMRSRHDPAPCSRALGPAGEPSIATFLDVWAGGWFEMFPTVGYPRESDATSLLHGELVRLPWEVTRHDGRELEAVVTTVRSPFRVVRALEVEGSTLTVRERVENVGGEAARYLWGHHPCFARATFAGGRIEVDVEQAEVPEPPFDPPAAILVPGTPFEWPDAAGRDGPVDVAAIPSDPDGRTDHVQARLRSGRLRLTAPLYGRALTLEFELEQFPHLLLWENFRASGGFPFWRDSDTFALEPSSNPGRTVADADAADAERSLAGGHVLETEISVTWGPLEP